MMRRFEFRAISPGNQTKLTADIARVKIDKNLDEMKKDDKIQELTDTAYREALTYTGAFMFGQGDGRRYLMLFHSFLC